MKKLKLIPLLFLILVSVNHSYSADAPPVAAGGSQRNINKAGVTMGILHDPYVSFISINFHFNVFDFMRFTTGLGISLAQNVGVGVDILIPGLSLSPFVGIHYSYFFHG